MHRRMLRLLLALLLTVALPLESVIAAVGAPCCAPGHHTTGAMQAPAMVQASAGADYQPVSAHGHAPRPGGSARAPDHGHHFGGVSASFVLADAAAPECASATLCCAAAMHAAPDGVAPVKPTGPLRQTPPLATYRSAELCGLERPPRNNFA